MTESDNADVPDFDDPTHAEIRALLGDAAATDPMPAEVAGELDDLLANLVAERAASADPTVVPFRRGRVARRLLVAAAAVILVGAGGVGLNQVLQDTSTTNDSTASGASAPDLTAEAPAPAGGIAEKGNDGNIDRSSETAGSSPLAQAYADLQANADFTRNGFDQQVKGLVGNVTGTGPFNDLTVPNTDSPGSPAPTELGAEAGGKASNAPKPDAWLKRLAARKSPHCPGPPATGGVLVVPITFEGRPATLAVHPVVNGTRYVAAWSCDGHRLLAYTTAPG